MPLHAGGVLPHGEWNGALLGRHAPPVGLHLRPRPPEHRPVGMQGGGLAARPRAVQSDQKSSRVTEGFCS